MPHVIVKLWPGKTEDQKVRLSEQIVKSVMDVLDCESDWVSVAIEDVESTEWPEKVYKPDILDKPDKIYKKPGYNPFE